MPEDQNSTSSTVAPTDNTVATSPAISAASAADSITVTPTPITEVTPTETKAVAESVKTETVIENVLGGTKTDVKIESKVEDAKVQGEIKIPTETEIKIELPKYEDFKLPEHVKIDAEELGEFSKLLGEIETGKLDHKGYQEAGQKFVDLATKATKNSIDNLNKAYIEFHENQKKEWFNNFKNDAEIGGDKFESTTELLRDAVSQYGGTSEQVEQFRQVMKDTGVGNNIVVARLLYNMAQKINKYETESDNGNGGNNRIVSAVKPAPTKVKDYQRFYG